MSKSLPVHKTLSMCLCIYIYIYLFKGRGRGWWCFKTNPRGPAVFQNHMQMLQSWAASFIVVLYKTNKQKKVTEVTSLSGSLPAAGFFGVLVPAVACQDPRPGEVVPGLAAAKAFG